MKTVWETFWKTLWQEHRGAAVGTLFGLFFGVLYLIVGFWDTLVFALILLGGFFLGRHFDKKEDLRSILSRLLPEKFFRR